jgi:FlgD Ig-like domain
VRKLAPTILVAALLVATATAFAVTEHLKLEDSPVVDTAFPKLFSPKLVEARIKFRLRREEEISLDIADENGRVVKHAVGSGVFPPVSHQFAWDGRDDSGRVVPDGTYHVQLTLKDENRTIEFPQTITADSTPPVIQDVVVRHGVFSPDGDGRADRVDLRYRFNEPAWATLYVDGRRAGRSYRKKPVGTMQWYGRGTRPGEYRLALAAQDRAGNIGPSTREFTVRLRYVELFRKRFRPRVGRTLRVRVSSDAETLTWKLGNRSGTGKAPLLRIPVPAQPGRYTLAVRANGHRASATVVVRR